MTERLNHVSTALSDAEFHALTDALLKRVEQTLDAWLQEDVVDIDARRTGGLLELDLPNRSKIVLNTQPPLHELWLAAQAGGFHFQYRDGFWRDTKTGDEFLAVLSREASRQAGLTLRFSA